MNTNSLVLVGNLVDAPEVQLTQAGAVRTRFRMASTERRRDAATETWQDGETVFLQVVCWRRLAQNVGNSLQKGDRVIVVGRLRQWTSERDGVRRTLLEVDAESIGPDLQRGMATIARPRRAPSVEGEVGDVPEQGGQPEPASEPASGSLSGSLSGTPSGAVPEAGSDPAPGTVPGAPWAPALVEVGG